MRVAVIEDERRFAEALKKGLEYESHTVEVFPDGASAREKLEFSGNTYDLVILDLMLPDQDGASICTHLRNTGVLSPILVLTARDGIEEKIDLFDRGADDFLTKPFDFEELLARSRALTRRKSKSGKCRRRGDGGDCSIPRSSGLGPVSTGYYPFSVSPGG